MEGAQTGMRAFRGYGPQEVTRKIEEWHWESQPQRVKAPYSKSEGASGIRSTTRHVEPCRKSGGPPPKAKYSLVTDSA
ncbi:hypothetical protein EUBVEN_00033 [Eubacterium ventriosum ATCC 27560]|uniref:Uncharacterized protein n=1 Tax=Eubacterium ventriosum ATCC 27560 TaxID=411463 RepID=A5Z302_9FIRM|nr:hypothetical protein EUBVEN_00033 [Eubacterium ventriosum ATCC 27560]